LPPWAFAIPSQDADRLGLGQCARSAPAVPDGQGSNIPGSVGRKKSS
jgi:hypothetical protein